MLVDLMLELGSSGRLHLLCATVPRLGMLRIQLGSLDDPL